MLVALECDDSAPGGREVVTGLDIGHMDGLAQRLAFLVRALQRHFLSAHHASSSRRGQRGSLIGRISNFQRFALHGTSGEQCNNGENSDFHINPCVSRQTLTRRCVGTLTSVSQTYAG
jgi:hypothetical protein